HNQRGTKAVVSEKVARCLAYHASRRAGNPCSLSSRAANKLTNAYSPHKQGVVRAMAFSDHCRCVSMPRCARASSKVTSICHLRTNHARLCCGVAANCVESHAWVANFSCGSRINTQRIGTAGMPV